jgi:hypothetical protein
VRPITLIQLEPIRALRPQVLDVDERPEFIP